MAAQAAPSVRASARGLPPELWPLAPDFAAAAPDARDTLAREIAQQRLELAQLRRSLHAKREQLRRVEQVLDTTQGELELAGRLALLGQMAKNIAHALSQPLSELRTFARNARAFVAAGNPAKAAHALQRMEDSGERMAATLAQLKALAARHNEACSAVNLQHSLQACARLLQADYLQAGVQLQVQAVDPVCAWGNSARVEQLLLSLLRNALDASAGADAAQQRRVKLVLLRDGGQALVKVRDSGAGLGEQALQHLFEPFFTTKPWGQGLGLGLYIARSIAQAMHGTLEGRNHGDGGAEFTLRLPLSGVGPSMRPGVV